MATKEINGAYIIEIIFNNNIFKIVCDMGQNVIQM